MSEHKSGGAKPAIAERLEKDAASLQKKRSSLSKEDVETKLKEAEERRQVRREGNAAASRARSAGLRLGRD